MTKRHQLWLANYLKTRNATAASRATGYSEKSASTQGSRMLARPDISAAIAAHDAADAARIEKKSALTAVKIYEELNNLVSFDPAKLYDENGKMLKIKDMDESTRKAIAGIEEKLDGTKLRISSKLGSLELASKLLGILRQEPANQQAIQIIVRQAPERTEPIVSVGQLRPEWE